MNTGPSLKTTKKYQYDNNTTNITPIDDTQNNTTVGAQQARNKKKGKENDGVNLKEGKRVNMVTFRSEVHHIPTEASYSHLDE